MGEERLVIAAMKRTRGGCGKQRGMTGLRRLIALPKGGNGMSVAAYSPRLPAALDSYNTMAIIPGSRPRELLRDLALPKEVLREELQRIGPLSWCSPPGPAGPALLPAKPEQNVPPPSSCCASPTSVLPPKQRTSRTCSLPKPTGKKEKKRKSPMGASDGQLTSIQHWKQGNDGLPLTVALGPIVMLMTPDGRPLGYATVTSQGLIPNRSIKMHQGGDWQLYRTTDDQSLSSEGEGEPMATTGVSMPSAGAGQLAAASRLSFEAGVNGSQEYDGTGLMFLLEQLHHGNRMEVVAGQKSRNASHAGHEGSNQSSNADDSVSTPPRCSPDHPQRRSTAQCSLSLRLEEAATISAFPPAGAEQWTPATPAKSEEAKRSAAAEVQVASSLSLDAGFTLRTQPHPSGSSASAASLHGRRSESTEDSLLQTEEEGVERLMGVPDVSVPSLFLQQPPAMQLPPSAHLDSIGGSFHPVGAWNYEAHGGIKEEEMLPGHLGMAPPDDFWRLDIPFPTFDMDTVMRTDMAGLNSDDMSLQMPTADSFQYDELVSVLESHSSEGTKAMADNSMLRESVGNHAGLPGVEEEPSEMAAHVEGLAIPKPRDDLRRLVEEQHIGTSRNFPFRPSPLPAQIAKEELSEEDDDGLLDDLLEESLDSPRWSVGKQSGLSAVGDKRKRGLASLSPRQPKKSETEQARAARNRRNLMKDALRRVTEFVPAMRQQFVNDAMTTKESSKKMDTNALLKELADHAKKLVRDISIIAVGKHTAAEDSEDEDNADVRRSVNSVSIADSLEAQRSKSKEEKAAARARRMQLRKMHREGSTTKQRDKGVSGKEFEAKWVVKLRPLSNRQPLLSLEARGFKVVRSPWKLSDDPRDPATLTALGVAEFKLANLEKMLHQALYISDEHPQVEGTLDESWQAHVLDFGAEKG